MARSPNMFAAPAEPKLKRKRLLVSAEVAGKLLSVSPQHLRTQANAGKVPHVKIGGRLLFRIKTLRRWIADQEMASVKQSA